MLAKWPQLTTAHRVRYLRRLFAVDIGNFDGFIGIAAAFGGKMPRHMLQGLKEIADHLGVQAHALDARRLILSWISREGLPAKRLAGRWYADAAELERWWVSRGGRKERIRASGPD